VKHRLFNPGEGVLEIIEVHLGEYGGENDIVRFDDEYGRELIKHIYEGESKFPRS